MNSIFTSFQNTLHTSRQTIISYICVLLLFTLSSHTHTMQSFYVVWVGKQPGIYTSWGECELQTKSVRNAKFKKYSSYSEALNAIALSPPFAPWVSPPPWPFVLPPHMATPSQANTSTKSESSSTSSYTGNTIKLMVKDNGKEILLEGHPDDVCHMINNLKM